jgi:hypothetical protein
MYTKIQFKSNKVQSADLKYHKYYKINADIIYLHSSSLKGIFIGLVSDYLEGGAKRLYFIDLSIIFKSYSIN